MCADRFDMIHFKAAKVAAFDAPPFVALHDFQAQYGPPLGARHLGRMPFVFVPTRHAHTTRPRLAYVATRRRPSATARIVAAAASMRARDRPFANLQFCAGSTTTTAPPKA